MKYLKVAASLVNLAVVTSFSASCSTVSPPSLPPSSPTLRRSAPSADVEQPMLAPHLPAAVANGAALLVGTIGGQQPLSFIIHLPLRNQTELTQLLRDLYDPASPSFHKYLRASEFTERFGPTAADYEAVLAWAKASGFSVTATAPNRRLVAVQGAAAAVNRALHITVNLYRHPTEGRNFYSPDREPTVVGLAVPLLQITGLNDYVLPHPMLRQKAAAARTGSAASGEYLPSDLRAAYYGTGALTGAGQSIGILSFDGYLASDVQLYYSTTGMSSTVPINNVLVGGFNGACTGVTSSSSGACDDGEQVLDIVNAIGMAPGIQQILFYEGSSSSEILNQMAIDNLAKVLSSSWGWNPADAASDDPIFQEFAAQGQSFVSASGDDGGFNGSTYSFPAVDPYVTEVGGTQLTTAGPGGAWVAETGWPHSGGGYVSGTPIPAWQQLAGVVSATNQGSSTLRNSPDVAAEADFDNSTVINGRFVAGYGGTSFAAPRWAGFLALVNQQSLANDRSTVGFINPALYNLGVSSRYGAALHDITSGSNPPTSGGGSSFNAVPGYDLVTGWGSPAGAALIDQLAGSGASPNGVAASAAGPAATPQAPVFMYPKKGQSQAQQAADQRECAKWAAQVAGAGAAGGYYRAMTACGDARGYSVK
jgi:subtilase family serine protease